MPKRASDDTDSGPGPDDQVVHVTYMEPPVDDDQDDVEEDE